MRGSSTRLLLVGAATIAVTIAGCGVGPWAQRPAPADAPRAAQAPEPTVYYTGEAGLPLHAAPGFDSETLATLPLHQKVLRTRTERGFAFVEVDGTGEQGWVENDKLIWRLPEAPPEPPPARAPVPAAEAPAEVPAKAPAEVSTSSPDPDDAAPSVAPPDPDQARPAVFDPF